MIRRTPSGLPKRHERDTRIHRYSLSRLTRDVGLRPLANRGVPVSTDRIVIVGGALMGSAIAWNLAHHPERGGREILVLEPDPSYRHAASALSAASIRQQFTSAVNIHLSLYGIRFLREVSRHLGTPDDPVALGLMERGYLFLADTPARASALTQAHALQQACGADILQLAPTDLAAKFPWLTTSDVRLGTWGRTGEGWFDAQGLLMAYRRAARRAGVVYHQAKAIQLRPGSDNQPFQVITDTDQAISAAHLVLAAGAASVPLLAPLADPPAITSRSRSVFHFTCPTSLPDFPLLIDPTGTYCRPEGQGFIAGRAPDPDQDHIWVPGEDPDYAWFEDTLWPILAHRVPAFEALRVTGGWTGPYDMHALDHNAVLGPVDGVPGLFIACGFSGHGVQQSPGVGRGLAEWILEGHPHSLDLTPLSWARLAAAQAQPESAVV